MCIPHPNSPPDSSASRGAQNRILFVLGRSTQGEQATQIRVSVGATARVLYQLQIDRPLLIPSFSAILCTVRYPNQQVLFTTALFEVSPTSRRLRQMTSTVRFGGHLTSQWFSVPSSGAISDVVWL